MSTLQLFAALSLLEPKGEMSVSPTTAALVISGLVTPILGFVLSEFRLNRQRRWDRQDRHRIAGKADEAMGSLHNLIHDTKTQAEAAYTEANQTNKWRATFTKESSDRQAAAVLSAAAVLGVAADTNQQIHTLLALTRMPAGLPGRDGVDGADGLQGPRGEKGDNAKA